MIYGGDVAPKTYGENLCHTSLEQQQGPENMSKLHKGPVQCSAGIGVAAKCNAARALAV